VRDLRPDDGSDASGSSGGTPVRGIVTQSVGTFVIDVTSRCPVRDDAPVSWIVLLPAIGTARILEQTTIEVF